MSIISNLAVLGGLGALQTVLLRQGRSIAGIVPDVVITESHNDELAITNHPVEQGAAITDHAFKLPTQITLRYGFADRSGPLNVSGPGSPQAIYDLLLSLQASRQPFDVVTGKRSYKNMLMKSLSTVTDGATENVLIVTASLQQIIVVETRVVTVAPMEDHKFPESTAPIENRGTKQAKEVSPSLIYRVKTLVTGG